MLTKWHSKYLKGSYEATYFSAFKVTSLLNYWVVSAFEHFFYNKFKMWLFCVFFLAKLQ